MTLEATEFYCELANLSNKVRKDQIPGGNVNATPADIYDYLGYGELWVDNPPSPGPGYAQTIGPRVDNPSEKRVEQVNTWEALPAEQKRTRIAALIEEQIPDASVKELVRDPLVETDIARYQAAATDKSIELQETADEDLDAFDTTLDVTPPQDGKGYSRFSVDIRELEPWPDAPDNSLGFKCVLDIQTDYEDQGAEARLYVIDAPSDVGAVLPFVQDATDPKKWTVEARDGHKWADTDQPCTVQLLWGAGSLPVSAKLTCKGQNNRKSQIVRYSVPTTRGRGRGRGRGRNR